MDTSDHPSFGRLAGLHAQLVAQNVRVEAVVNGQLDGVERLFRAATNRDWEGVARASDDLARQQVDATNKAVVRSAKQVCKSLRRDPSGARASRSLNALLTACRLSKVQRGRS